MLPRAVRLRQDHAPARYRRTRHPEQRTDRAGRQGHLRSAAVGARLRHRLPVLRAVSQPHRRAQHRLRAREPPRQARRDRPPGRRAAGAGRPRGPRPQVSSTALGRPAAAGGARPGARPLARPFAARRAALGAGRQGARAPERRGPGAAAAARRDHDHGDPRPGRGADDGRSHRGHEPRRDRSGRHAERDLSRAGDPLRRRLHRHHELPARPGRPDRTGSESPRSRSACPRGSTASPPARP